MGLLGVMTVRLGVDLSGLQSGISNAQGLLGGFGGVAKAAFGLASDGVGLLKNELVSSVQAAMQHQQVMAQTTQAIKSTGDASGMSAASIENLATSLSKVTPFSEDTIQSGENLLLTFTGIGKDVFPMTTNAMLDMAQAMHTGPTQAAMQLGKALNDPAKGLTALQRVGVTFSASEQQQIKTMMAHNDIIGAQKIMLGELAKEFGGSATAAGQTFSGQLQILKNDFEDVKVKVGTALLPILSQFTGWISSTAMPILDKFGDWFVNTAVPAINGFKDTIGKVITYVGNVLKTVDLSDFKDAWQAVSGEVEYVARKFGDLFNAASPLGNILKQVGTDFDPIADIIQKLAQGALNTVSNLLWGISGAFINVDSAAQKGKGPIAEIGNVFKQIKPFIQSLGDAFSQLGPPLSTLGNALKGELGKELKDLGQDAQQLGGWFLNSVLPAMQQALPGFTNLAKTILDTVGPALVQIRGIVVDVIQHAFEKFAPIIEKIVPPLIKFAGILANDLANGIKVVTPYILQAAKAVGDFAKDIEDRVAPIVDKWIKDLTPLVQDFMVGWKQEWPVISAVLKGVWDEIQGIVKVAWAIVSGIVKIGLDIMGGNWKQAWNDLKDMLKGVWDGIKQWVKGGIESLVGMFKPLLEAMSNIPGPAGDMAKSVLKSFGDMSNGATTSANDMKLKSVQSTIDMQQQMVANFDQTRQQLIQKMKDTSDPVQKHALEMQLGVTTQMENLHKNALDKANDMKDQLVGHSIIPDMCTDIVSCFTDLASKMPNLGSNIVKNIAAGITGAIHYVQDAIHNVTQWISDHLPHSPAKVGPLRDLQLQGSLIPEQISLGIESNMSKLNVTMNKLPYPGSSATSNSTNAVLAALAASNGNNGKTVIENHLYIDGKEVTSRIGPHIADAIRRQGVRGR